MSGGSGDTDIDYWELKGWLEELLMLQTDGQRGHHYGGGSEEHSGPSEMGGPDGVSKVN